MAFICRGLLINIKSVVNHDIKKNKVKNSFGLFISISILSCGNKSEKNASVDSKGIHAINTNKQT